MRSRLRHPIRAAEHEAAHLHEIVDEGESPATPAIIGGTVLAVAATLVAIMITLALGVAYLATRDNGGGATPTQTTTITNEK